MFDLYRRSVSRRIAMLFVSCASSTLVASPATQLDVPARLQGSAAAVVATVKTVNAEWRQNAYGDRLIVSRIRLGVEETLKGSGASELWLDLEGGTLGGFTLRVSTVPTLRPGERAVFLLDTQPSGSYVPHLKGLGILKLSAANEVEGSSLRLEDIRQMASQAK